jgi:hypothetical protein
MSTNERSRKEQTETEVGTDGRKGAARQVRIGSDHCSDDSDTVSLEQLPEADLKGSVGTSEIPEGNDPYNTGKKPTKWPAK